MGRRNRDDVSTYLASGHLDILPSAECLAHQIRDVGQHGIGRQSLGVQFLGAEYPIVETGATICHTTTHEGPDEEAEEDYEGGLGPGRLGRHFGARDQADIFARIVQLQSGQGLTRGLVPGFGEGLLPLQLGERNGLFRIPALRLLEGSQAPAHGVALRVGRRDRNPGLRDALPQLQQVRTAAGLLGQVDSAGRHDIGDEAAGQFFEPGALGSQARKIVDERCARGGVLAQRGRAGVILGHRELQLGDEALRSPDLGIGARRDTGRKQFRVEGAEFGLETGKSSRMRGIRDLRLVEDTLQIRNVTRRDLGLGGDRERAVVLKEFPELLVDAGDLPFVFGDPVLLEGQGPCPLLLDAGPDQVHVGCGVCIRDMRREFG